MKIKNYPIENIKGMYSSPSMQLLFNEAEILLAIE